MELVGADSVQSSIFVRVHAVRSITVGFRVL